MQLQNEKIQITLKAQGAEMTSWKVSGTELLWQGDPTYWGRQAPILFPIVGRLLDDQYVYEGNTYTMSQHGFARDAMFEIESSTATSVRFTLNDTSESRQHYPFPFTLTVSYQLVGEEVIVTYRVHNPGETTLPFSIVRRLKRVIHYMWRTKKINPTSCRIDFWFRSDRLVRLHILALAFS